jgi:penicillin-binding protein 1C
MRYSLMILLMILSSCSRQSFEQVKKNHPSSFKEILDADGELLHETRTNFKRHRRAWTKLSEISPELINEVIRFEDQRFYSHAGVDVFAILNSVKEYPKRGASTVTMQLVGMLNHESGRRGITSKLKQIASALSLEASWSKKEILEAWINLMSFKGEAQGIRAASFSLFKKDSRGLNLSERLILYALIPSPNQSKEKTLERACRYLKKTDRDAKCEDLRITLDQSSFDAPKTLLSETHAPHLAQKLRTHSEERIQTTVIKSLQIEAQKILRTHLKILKQRNVQDGAVLILERKSGKVLAYVGSSGDLSKAPLVDHIQSLRQAGSTLKPLLYASAIQKRLMTMTTPLRDEPFTVTREGLTYQPENYQKGFTFLDVPAKVALGSSLNIPAVRVIDYLGPEKFYHLLDDLEFRNLAPVENYGHSMALGAVDVTLWDLTRSYLTLAGGGNFIEPIITPDQIKKQKNIRDLSPEVSFIISQILSEKNNRYLTFGIQSTLSSETWSAVKTGTSKDMRDNWCVGYTSDYVIGVWAGNSSGSPMWNVTGISGAAPVFAQLVSYLHQRAPSLSPSKPDTIVEMNGDYYLLGTEPKGEIKLVEQEKVAKIIFPQNGAQFAYDPEIPRKNQRVNFQGSGENISWRLNGKYLSKKELDEGFFPQKRGKYILELLDHDLKKDEVAFYVKSGKAHQD